MKCLHGGAGLAGSCVGGVQIQGPDPPPERVWVGALCLWCLSGSELELGPSPQVWRARFSVILARRLTASTGSLDLDLCR